MFHREQKGMTAYCKAPKAIRNDIHLCSRVNINVTQSNTTLVNIFIQANMSEFAYIECIGEECWLLGRTLSHWIWLLVYTSHKYYSVSSTVRNRLMNKSFTKRTLRLVFSAYFLTPQFLHEIPQMQLYWWANYSYFVTQDPFRYVLAPVKPSIAMWRSRYAFTMRLLVLFTVP